jgi:hypothetical protein
MLSACLALCCERPAEHITANKHCCWYLLCVMLYCCKFGPVVSACSLLQNSFLDVKVVWCAYLQRLAAEQMARLLRTLALCRPGPPVCFTPCVWLAACSSTPACTSRQIATACTYWVSLLLSWRRFSTVTQTPGVPSTFECAGLAPFACFGDTACCTCRVHPTSRHGCAVPPPLCTRQLVCFSSQHRWLAFEAAPQQLL